MATPDLDAMATIQAIDVAFNARVELLFRNLADALGDDSKAWGTTPRPDTPAEGKALKHFKTGLAIARRSRVLARREFVKDGD